jgi:hypothetical protein
MRSCIAAAACGQALSWSIATPWLNMPCCLFHFVFIRKHLRYHVWAQFPKTKFVRQFHEEVTMKFVENARKVAKWWIVCSLKCSLPLHTPNLHKPRTVGYSVDHHAYFRVLHESVSPISLPLNYSWHVLRTPHKVYVEYQPVSCFLHPRNGLQTAFHMRRASWVSWTFKTHRTMGKCDLIVCKLCQCLPKEPTNSACFRTMVIAALQWQYLQTELILWIHLVQISQIQICCWRKWEVRIEGMNSDSILKNSLDY